MTDAPQRAVVSVECDVADPGGFEQRAVVSGGGIHHPEIAKRRVVSGVEEVFVEKGAVQCGFCIPGMVISAMAFLKEANPPFSENDIKWAIAGNMCRCTGYTKIIDAITDLGQKEKLISQVKQEWPD